MAITNGYTTLNELKSQARIPLPDSVDDPILEAVIETASRQLDDWCRGSNSHFYASSTASARTYQAKHWDLVEVDDIWSTDGLVVKTDDDDDGVFETTWTSSDYQLEPLNGIADSRAAWKLRAVGDNLVFPVSRRGRALVQVTAKWGWVSVPEPIREACIRQAVRLLKRRDAPFGVIEAPDMGTGERLFAALDPDAKMLAYPYVKHPHGI